MLNNILNGSMFLAYGVWASILHDKIWLITLLYESNHVADILYIALVMFAPMVFFCALFLAVLYMFTRQYTVHVSALIAVALIIFS